MTERDLRRKQIERLVNALIHQQRLRLLRIGERRVQCERCIVKGSGNLDGPICRSCVELPDEKGRPTAVVDYRATKPELYHRVFSRIIWR